MRAYLISTESKCTNPVTDSWSIRAPMLEKRSGFTAVVNNGIIYVFGGEGVKRILNSVEKYNPKIDRVSYEASMPTARFGLKAVSFEDRIFVIGGQLVDASGLVPLDLLEVFHIASNKIK